MKEPKVRYYLEAKFKDTEKRLSKELVMAEINYAYWALDGNGNPRIKPIRYSLQTTILPINFGSAENKYKLDNEIFRKFSKSNATVKNVMAQLDAAIIELYNYYIHNLVTPTPAEFKLELNIKLNRVKRELKLEMPILGYLNKKIVADKADLLINKKDKIKNNTIKTYVTVSHLIENYQLATNDILQFKSFDSAKYWNLWDVLDDIIKDKIKVVNPNQPRKQRKQEFGYLSVTVRKYQKLLLHTLKDANKEGLRVPLDIFDTNLILGNSEASKSFYIEEKLLKKVIAAKLEADKDLQLAKEYLIIGCLTGMRYESMNDSKNAIMDTYKENGYNFDYIHSIQNKTSTEVCIPLLKPVQEILKKHGKFPIFKSNSKMNEALKKLFAFLNINRLEDVVKIPYKGEPIKTKEPISKLISTHDCKGSFYSNLYEVGVSTTVIDTITHPDKPEKNPMAKTYNKVEMITKAKFFVDAIKKISKTDVYKF